MIPYSEIVLRLVTAALLGSLIGFERERLNWAAGLRTHMLVCVGACLVIIVSSFGFSDALKLENVALDPSRVAAQVVSGIGFLGAGTILLWQKKTIRGLTTAASLWAVAGVGLAVGGGLYFAAFMTTILILVILAGIKPLERRFLRKNFPMEFSLLLKSGTFSLSALEQALSNAQVTLRQIRFSADLETQEEVQLVINETSQGASLLVLEELRKLPGILKIEFINR